MAWVEAIEKGIGGWTSVGSNQPVTDKSAQWRRGVHLGSVSLKSVDGLGRLSKLFELCAENIPGLENLTPLLKDARGFQQPLYRLGMGFDYLANPKDKEDYWRSYRVTRLVCPVTLIGVSVLGLAVFLEKKGVFSWKTLNCNREAMQWRARVAGTVGAGIAAGFSVMDMAYCFTAKHDGLHGGKADKLGAQGWNDFWAGSKYTCEMTCGILILMGRGAKLQTACRWGGAIFGVVQFFQKAKNEKK